MANFSVHFLTKQQTTLLVFEKLLTLDGVNFTKKEIVGQ